MKARHLGDLLMQGAHWQVVDMRHSSTKREHTIAARLSQHLLDDAGARDQARALHPSDVGVCAVKAGVWCT